MCTKKVKPIPMAWVDVVDSKEGPYHFHGIELMPTGKHDLYLAQPSKKWVGLTDEEIIKLDSGVSRKDFVKIIEAKLKELNA